MALEGIGSGEDGDCVSDCNDLLFHKKEKNALTQTFLCLQFTSYRNPKVM